MTIEERIRQLTGTAEIQKIWQYLEDMLPDILAEAVLVQQIPSPTFQELVRANHVLSRLGSCGLIDTGLDNLNNAFGRLSGSDPEAPALLFSAHTDTVFGEDTDLTIHRDDDERIYGPGIGDNSTGVAGLIALADILRQFSIQPRCDIWFLANSREEGLGDLGGIKAFYESHAPQIGQAVVLEGMALGQIYHAGIAVRRLRVVCTAEGGHSWQHFGRPSAIHSLLRLGARLTELQVPQSPRTTFNIGLISGGHSVNSLATEASFYLDLRSEDTATLAGLEAEVMGIIDSFRAQEIPQFEVMVVGDRPAGAIPRDHMLAQTAAASIEAVGLTPSFRCGSTDANLLLARGVPTITIGLTRGDNSHRTDEYIQIEPLRLGMRQLVLLALTLCEWEPQAAPSKPIKSGSAHLP
jgi:tripeptide aminopeptidase